MNRTIDWTPTEAKLVVMLLQRYLPGVKVWAYGSRARWNARPDSDLDLVVFADRYQKSDVSELREALEESSLPYKVDLFVWDEVPDNFRPQIEKERVEISPLAAASSPAAAGSSATPLSGARPRNAPMRLKDLLLITKDGEWGKGEPGDGLTEMQVIRGTDFATVRFGELEGVPIRFIPTAIALRKTLEPKDILIETAGGTKDQPTGRTVYLKERVFEVSNAPLTCASFARFLRVDQNLADPEYVYWFLQSIYRTDAMQKYHLQHTGVARFQYTTFSENTLVPLPSIGEQKSIARILGALDDKIELNRRINRTLEEMAQALFKSWFVDFDPVKAKASVLEAGGTPEEAEQAAMQVLSGKSVQELDAFQRDQPEAYADLARTASLFPSRLVESELGQIPEGWNVSTIGDEVRAVGGGTPSTKESDFWDDGCHYWATPKDLSKLQFPVILETERKITDAGLAKISSGLLPPGTLLLSSRAPIGYMAITEVSLAINQGFIAMVCDKKISNIFAYFWCKENMGRIVGNANGSTFQEISKSNFRPLPMCVPSTGVLAKYSASVDNMHRQMVSNQIEVTNLTALRDSLLPKLLSGELEIPDELLAEASA